MERVDFTGYRVDCVTDFALDYLPLAHARTAVLPLPLLHRAPPPERPQPLRGPGRLEGAVQGLRRPRRPGRHRGRLARELPRLPGRRSTAWTRTSAASCRRLRSAASRTTRCVLFTSDHGSHFRTRNGEYKRACHEGCVRMPMIACGPGFTGGQVVRRPGQPDRRAPDHPGRGRTGGALLHARPSAAAARRRRGGLAGGGLHPDQREPGRPGAAHGALEVLGPRPREAGLAATPASDRYVEDFLYDLDADPHEKSNLVADPAHADVRADLAARLKAHIAEIEGMEVSIDPAPAPGSN